MAEIKSVTREAIKLVDHIIQGNEKLAENIEKYNKQIEEERLGVKQGQEMIQEEKDEFTRATREQAQDLLERLNRAAETTLKHIEDNKESVTSENVAELQLLAQVDTTSEELKKYAEKYSNNDLALRLLEKIAKEQGIMFALPETEQDKIKKEYSKVRTIVNSYNSFSPNIRNVQAITDNLALKLERASLEEML